MKEIPAGLLEEVTARLVEAFDPEAVYLFGSHAWGEPTQDSDIDLAVIVAWEDAPTHKDFVRAHTCLGDLKVAKDILVKQQTRFERYRHVPASLEYKIAEKGKLLYERTRDHSGEKRTRSGMVSQS